ncbi:MAG: PspC domain-containing protein [Chlorobi bacterium]|nr:PspC domain-containing protein [Chlorobiota bacterium]
MKKTITINLGGMVFNIDDDAYTLLRDYLQAVGKHYAREETSSEILEDIEARMAELFRERMTGAKQVITRTDTEEVVSIMGYPEDFAAEEGPDESYYHRRSRSRRIYRDPDNSVLGGVCGGMGAYFNLDPLIFRILFLILFFGAGTGLILYIILWIVVPEAKTTAQKLEMRGESVNVSNIGRKVKEEFNHVREKMNL